MNVGAEIYLDTARLGRMRKSAQWAVRDFARLAGEAALTLYGTNFLAYGFGALSGRHQQRCPRLENWRGIEQLKRRLLDYAAADSDQDCLLASRSVTLIRLGAQLIAYRFKRVLIPDLFWRPYAAAVRAIVEAQGVQVVPVNLRREIFTQRNSAEEVTERIVNIFTEAHCDCACLPAVTHDGIRLPVDGIIERIRSLSRSAFVMVDAAQALGHMPTGLGINSADLVVAGVHKWLEAGIPLGIGSGPHTVVNELLQMGHDDPLLTFTGPSGSKRVSETANLWPLISCNAAIGDPLALRHQIAGALANRLANRRAILQVLRGTQWEATSSHSSLRSGILLLSHKAGRGPRRNIDEWRNHFQGFGIALSSYPGSLLRVSLPARRMGNLELALLAAALGA